MVDWMAPGKSDCDDLALVSMPIWAAFWISEHGSLTDAEVVFSYIGARLEHFPVRDLEMLARKLREQADLIFECALPDSEDRVLMSHMGRFARDIDREIERRRGNA